MKSPPRFVLSIALVLSPTAVTAQFPGECGPPDAVDPDFCGTFRRGDANGDRSVDLSDGVTTLSYLFLGTTVLTCGDGADADDSGVLDLSDAVYTFTYLFLGGPAPPSPGPLECGPDPTPDPLFCEDLDPCRGVPAARDFSTFTRFEYRFEALCGLSLEEPGDIFSASITSSEGGYVLDLSLLEAGEEGVGDCLPQSCSGCFVARTLSRSLTAGEVDRMTEVFAGTTVLPVSDPCCGCFPQDPPGIARFEWDGEQVTDFHCAAPFMGRGDAEEIVAFLESLANP